MSYFHAERSLARLVTFAIINNDVVRAAPCNARNWPRKRAADAAAVAIWEKLKDITMSECLAACGYGPVAQIAERGKPDIPLYFENLDLDKIEQILDSLEKGEVPVHLGH